jgi:hypothetical protein
MVKPNDEVLSQREARSLLKISQGALDKIKKKKEIPYQMSQGCYFYLKADCVDWILKNQPERLKEVGTK